MNKIDINDILEIISGKTQNKSSHIFLSESIASSLFNEYNDEVITKIEAIIKDFSTLNDKSKPQYFLKNDDYSWGINQSTSNELREIIAEISSKYQMPVKRGEWLYNKIINSSKLKAGDFIKRSSRNNEAWFRQNVGNAFRKSQKDELKIGYVFNEKNKTIIASILVLPFGEMQNKPNDMPLPQLIKTTSYSYIRNSLVAKQAKVIAEYKCFYGCDMKLHSFKDCDNNNYTESHHLIPMSTQKLFGKNNIDRIENIIVLCSKHHNAIHYSIKEEKERLLKEAYNYFYNDPWFKETIPTLQDLLKLY